MTDLDQEALWANHYAAFVRQGGGVFGAPRLDDIAYLD